MPCNTVGDEGWFTQLTTQIGARRPHLDHSFLSAIYQQMTATGYPLKQEKGNDTFYKTADTIPDTWRKEYGGAIRQYPVHNNASTILEVYKDNMVLHKNSTQYFGPLQIYCYGCTDLRSWNKEYSGNHASWPSLHENEPRETRVQEDIPFFCRQCEDQLEQGN